jgi:hypothetical protein
MQHTHARLLLLHALHHIVCLRVCRVQLVALAANGCAALRAAGALHGTTAIPDDVDVAVGAPA